MLNLCVTVGKRKTCCVSALKVTYRHSTRMQKTPFCHSINQDLVRDCKH